MATALSWLVFVAFMLVRSQCRQGLRVDCSCATGDEPARSIRAKVAAWLRRSGVRDSQACVCVKRSSPTEGHRSKYTPQAVSAETPESSLGRHVAQQLSRPIDVSPPPSPPQPPSSSFAAPPALTSSPPSDPTSAPPRTPPLLNATTTTVTTAASPSPPSSPASSRTTETDTYPPYATASTAANKTTPRPRMMVPRMEPSELALWETTVAKAKWYFEFGSGGSTFLAGAKLCVPRITAVDSDALWLNEVEVSIAAFHNCTQPSDVSLRHVYIGPTGSWGYPVGRHYRSLWPSYPHSLELFLAPQDQQHHRRADEDVGVGANGRLERSTVAAPDVVFIDGRFRPACAAVTLLNVGPNVTLLWHDFSPDRPEYNVMLPYLDRIASAETMVVFRPKPLYNRTLLEELLVRMEDEPK